MDRTLYQTVEDRDNPDYVEEHGPFKCTNRNAWLGHGFYFWDTYITIAHWWGKLNYAQNGYVICQSSCGEDMTGVYDLVGKPELFEQIEQIASILKNKTNTQIVYVPEVFEFLKQNTSFLDKYKAIRVYPLNTFKGEAYTLKFNPKNKGFIETRPAIQFCVLDKSFLKSRYHIVYPKEYCADGVM